MCTLDKTNMFSLCIEDRVITYTKQINARLFTIKLEVELKLLVGVLSNLSKLSDDEFVRLSQLQTSEEL